MQSDVVAEIEEDAGNRYSNAGGEADVQRIEFLLDVPLVEILESDLALPVPDVAYFRSAEYGKAVRPFLNDVVSVDYGISKLWIDEVIEAISGMLLSGAFSGSGFEGDVAAVYRVRQFRLQEVAFEVYPHEERAEITYLIVILHLVDDSTVQH